MAKQSWKFSPAKEICQERCWLIHWRKPTPDLKLSSSFLSFPSSLYPTMGSFSRTTIERLDRPSAYYSGKVSISSRRLVSCHQLIPAE